MGALLAPVPGSAQEVQEMRPDIVALPAVDLSVVLDVLGTPTLRLGAITHNAGLGPLELLAGETGQGQGQSKQNVYQRIFLDDGGFYDHFAGSFEWHPPHNHFHFDDYASYVLQQAGSPGGSERIANKTTFCVMDTDLIDRQLPGAPKKAVYKTCGDQVQGMSVGWGDEYGAYLPGQEIDLTDLPDGDYTLKIVADPKNRLLELNDNNNTSCMLLRISVTDLTVDVLNENGCSDTGGDAVAVTGIEPNVLNRDSITGVTISGSGFSDGMNVAFENGAGSRPRVNNVTVVSATEITAMVTIGKKAKLQSWDLRVGPAVLAGAIIVQP